MINRALRFVWVSSLLVGCASSDGPADGSPPDSAPEAHLIDQTLDVPADLVADQSIPSDLAVDSAGNTYVTGLSDGAYGTVKISPTGGTLWEAYFTGPNKGNAYAQDVALDSAGNVYVTGAAVGWGTGDDYATVKYDADGNELWVARWPGKAPALLGLDDEGNVYVTGTANEGGCMVMVKYAQQAPALFLRGDCDSDGTTCSGVNDALTMLE